MSRRAPRLRFAKMHGLGNDFMVVDLVTQNVQPTARQIRAWADRRVGVGFDQFLEVLPPTDPSLDFRVRVFNADGAQAEQCGNGARCVARFVADAGLAVKKRLLLQTDGGAIAAEPLPGGEVQVSLPPPRLRPQDVPFAADEAAVVGPLRYAIDAAGQRIEATPVGMGNPHAVIFVADVEAADVAGVGAALQSHPSFPKAVNVGFLQVLGRCSGRLRVYERGVGETPACGSGACAAMVAGRLHDLFDDRATIELPGGALRLAWQGLGQPAKLAGAAQLVYEGSLPL